MAFTLSNNFVQQVRRVSPLKPITVSVNWFDDSGVVGRMAQLTVTHHKPHASLTVFVDVDRNDTNIDVLLRLRKKLIPWRFAARRDTP